MKYLLTTMLCFVCIASTAKQATIRFSIINNSLKPDIEPVNLRLPVELKFNKDQFNGKKIAILNDSDRVIGLQNKILGQDELLAPEDETDIPVQIMPNGKINPVTEGDENIKGLKRIRLMIDGFTPVVLSFANAAENNLPAAAAASEEAYQAGYLYYDVMKLLSTNDVGTRKQILAVYGINSSNYMQNPYIKDIFATDFGKGGAQGGGALLAGLGNTDITYFAAGLARFLAERAKQELNEAFFSKMKDQLNAYPELKAVFPNTSRTLNTIETYSYASVIQVLKEAFETDIQNLPQNLFELKNLTKTSCLEIQSENLKNKCESRMQQLEKFFTTQSGYWVALGLASVKEAAQSTNPAQLIKAITESDEMEKLRAHSVDIKAYPDLNLIASVELTNLVSQSLISKEDQIIWINAKQADSLFFKKKNAFKLYLGLVLALEQRKEQAKKIRFYQKDGSESTLEALLVKSYTEYESLKPLIKNTFAAFNVANNAAKKIMAAAEKSVEADPQSLYGYFTVFVSSLKAVLHHPLVTAIAGTDIGTGYDNPINGFLTPSIDIAYHLSGKKYSAAIYDISILLHSLNEVVDTQKKAIFKPLTGAFVKYGTLISTVANAQSSEEVKNAIDASVLPSGSYSIKRKTSWSMDINAYVGAFQRISGSGKTADNQPSLGLTAPIGFTISKGFSKTGKSGGLSLNMQIFDLGALVNYYLVKGDTASLANDFKVKLSNIFSPGINLGYNIPKTPLSFSIGGQYIPTLYQYQQIGSANELTASSAWRWQISLAVDIPLYHLKVWDFNR